MQEDWCREGADLLERKLARPAHAPEAVLTEQTCPGDRVLRSMEPVLLERGGDRKLYDCGERLPDGFRSAVWEGRRKNTGKVQ